MRQGWIPAGSSVPAPSARCSRWSGARRRPTWPRSSTATGWWPGTGAGSPRTSPRCFPIRRSTSWSSRTAPSSTGSRAGATSVGWRTRDGPSGRSSCPAGSLRSPQLRCPSSPTALFRRPTCSATRRRALEDAIDTDALAAGALRAAARAPARRARPADRARRTARGRHPRCAARRQRGRPRCAPSRLGPDRAAPVHPIRRCRAQVGHAALPPARRARAARPAPAPRLDAVRARPRLLRPRSLPAGTSARWWVTPPPSTNRRRLRDKPGSTDNGRRLRRPSGVETTPESADPG